MAGYENMMAETVRFNGHEGVQIDGYLARPMGPGPHGAVVLIHHMPGWDQASKEMARKLASNGYVTISPDFHYLQRQVVGTDASDADVSAYVREEGGMPDARAMGDVAGAMEYLRSLPYVNGRIGVIGFCSGGRQTYLAACTIPGIAAAVDCWGGGVVRSEQEITERQPVAPIDLTSGIDCPLLGLFGDEDTRPSPEAVAETEAELKRLGKTYEFHMYPNAGHGFFAVDRPSYRQPAAVDGWEKVLAWFDRYLKAPVAAGAGLVGAGTD